jgi:hypothetical protein
VERLPHIAIKDLVDKIPRDNPNAVYQLDAFGIGHGGAKLRVSTHALEATSTNGHRQVFKIKWVRTGFGRHRPLLVCSSCGRMNTMAGMLADIAIRPIIYANASAKSAQGYGRPLDSASS